MAILDDKLIESQQGFAKGIDQAGLGMVLDNMQKYQYSKPIHSTVREVASNSVDSMRERNIAISILTGESKVEDHFVEREGEVYEASKFDPSYYDLNWLSDFPDARIEYFEREDEDRDLLRFIDAGVGLGGKRLEGFFSLSYSTKRLNKSALGKFGIGAKAPLSTGVDSYRMTSYYNGQKYMFDIYLRHIHSLIDKWNESGQENNHHSFAGGEYEFYSENTTEKNGVVIELEVKKHQRAAVKEAVQNQLLYFSNIQFKIYHGDWTEEVPVKTEVYFENEDFIISRNNLFTRPHIVLGQPGAQINYGLIDFTELELESRTGNIGIKVNNEDVEITPSRESIIWSIPTRNVILLKFKKALETANEIVKEALTDEDILGWISKNVSLWSSQGNNPVLRQLSGMIDKSQVRSPYSVDSSIDYQEPKKIFGIFGMFRTVGFESKYVNNAYKLKIKRVEINSWPGFSGTNPLFITRESASPRKDAYIKSEYNTSQFALLSFSIKDDAWWKEQEERVIEQFKDRTHAALVNSLTKETLQGLEWTKEEKEAGVAKEMKRLRDEYNKGLLFLEYASKSAFYVDYDSIKVPEDWVDNVASEAEFDSENTQTIINSVTSSIDNAKRRKEEGKVFFKYASWATSHYISDGAYFRWNQKEEFAQDLNSFDGTLVFGTQMTREEESGYMEQGLLPNEYPSDENKLRMVSGILLGETGVEESLNPNSSYNLYPGDPDGYVSPRVRNTKDLMLIKVAKPLAKKLRNFIPISKFLLDQDEKGNLFTHMKIINWFTAKTLHDKLIKLEFLKNFKEISPYHTQEFEDLWQIVKDNYFNTWGNIKDYPSNMRDDFVKELTTIADFQKWIRDSEPSLEEVGEKSIETFGIQVGGANVIDLDLIDRADALIEWAIPIIDLVNNVPYFKGDAYVNKFTDKEEFLSSIRHYLRSKSVEMKELSDKQVANLPQPEIEEDEDEEEDED